MESRISQSFFLSKALEERQSEEVSLERQLEEVSTVALVVPRHVQCLLVRRCVLSCLVLALRTSSRSWLAWALSQNVAAVSGPLLYSIS